MHNVHALYMFVPFADKMCVFSAKVTSEGDTSNSKHVLHYLSLYSSVVSQ